MEEHALHHNGYKITQNKLTWCVTFVYTIHAESYADKCSAGEAG